jgi:hypothetical protein
MFFTPNDDLGMGLELTFAFGQTAAQVWDWHEKKRSG